VTTYIVAGIVVGSVYAIATLGLVLTYITSRIFNFAQGAVAFFVAVTFYQAVVKWGWNPQLAGVLTIFVFSPLLGLFLWAVLFRRLGEAPPAVRLVSTIGLSVALPALAAMLYPTTAAAVLKPSMLWSPAHEYTIVGVHLDSNQLAVVVAAALTAVVLTFLLRATPYGLSVRAAVDSATMARANGVNTGFVTAVSWMIGTMLAGTAGVLLGALRGFTIIQFTLLLLGSFAAVVVARMHSLALAFVGSMAIGLLQELSASGQFQRFLEHFASPTNPIILGIRPSIPFIVMLVFLLLYNGLQEERFTIDTRAFSEPLPDVVGRAELPWWRRLLPIAVCLAGVLVAPEFLNGLWLAVVASGLALAIAFLSYVVVTGDGGMISLCQITFAGIAAAITAQFATNHNVPVLLAVLIGAVIVVPVGMLAALPSLRLGSLYLALATLAFSQLVQNTYFQTSRISNFGQGVAVPRPGGFVGDRAFYYLLVVLFVVVALLVRNLERSTTGLNLAAMRSSEIGTATLGINIVWSKFVAFGLSAFIAGVGGGLYASYAGAANMNQFDALLGAVWLAVVVTWGVRSITGALLAGLSFTVIPQLVTDHFSGRWLNLPTLLFGLGAIALAREPRGILYDSANRRRARRRRRAEPRPAPLEVTTRAVPVS
jgi:branched-chain amino acid transport system permease protein